jgi:hypothetical protein
MQIDQVSHHKNFWGTWLSFSFPCSRRGQVVYYIGLGRRSWLMYRGKHILYHYPKKSILNQPDT